MDLIKMKKLVYRKLVDNNENVSQEFCEYVEKYGRNGYYFEKIMKILKLNFKYRILKKKAECSLDNLIMPESRVTQLPLKNELLTKLEQYDVVSFDVFDTLIFRAVNRPRDVFRLLEAEWNIMGFAVKREEAERKARKEKAEVTICNIYDILSKELSIDLEEGIKKEIEVEKKVCFANPYMKEIFLELQKKNKKLVLITDMYFSNKILVHILDRCGYHVDCDSIYVSCDYGKGKINGGLQQIVNKRLGKFNTYIHVGDSRAADLNGSKLAGWDTFYYPNISRVGNPYRRKEMQTLASAFYKGLINTKIHSGAFEGDEYYEYGYCYGGVLAVGYCLYLKRLAQNENFGQFLFLARDGYIVKKIYDQFWGDIESEYIPFSRFASYQLTIERTWKEMLQSVVLPKVNETKKTVKEILQACDLLYIEKYFDKYGLTSEQKFNLSVYEKIYHIFEENMEEIKENYKDTVKAAQKYFEGKVKNNAKVCIVDVGWKGTSISCLKYFLEEKCGMNVQVCGTVMGMIKDEAAEISLSNRTVFSYMFSAHHNQKTYLKHMGKHGEINYRNMLIEILFTEDNPTFLKFKLDKQGKVIFEYGCKENNKKLLGSLQKGIMDFAEDYLKYWMYFGDVLEICGQDAYIPVDSLAEAKKECIRLLGEYEIHKDPGIFDERDRCTYKEAAGH